MRLSWLRRGGAAAVILTGLVLFASALQGLTQVDGTLELAAARATPDRALTLETAGDRPAPRGWACDEPRRRPRV